MTEREIRAERVCRNAEAYRICCGCESIVAKGIDVCPNCHAYRFTDNALAVLFWAKAIGSREQRSVLAVDLAS